MPKDKVEYYYATWCHYCQEFSPQWEKFKNMINNKIEAMEYEASKDADKVDENKITGFPTIMVTKDGNTMQYNGPRNADALYNFVVNGTVGGNADEKYKQCGGGLIYQDEIYYKKKYCKYKAKYMKLKDELGL